jgi:TnsA endonuclease N terminal
LRRIPLSRRSHIIGLQPLPTGTAEHESALERDFVILSAFLDPRAVISAQPITITFQVGAVTRRYTPDYSVAWSNGKREIVEVKYLSDLRANQERFKERFAAMEDWAHARGASFRVATEREIRGYALENCKRLLPLRTAAFDPDIARSVVSAARRLAAPTFGAVLSAVPADRPSVLATLWCLLARGALYVDLSLPITPGSIIEVP